MLPGGKFLPSLVLFDLDGTLLNRDHAILPCSIETIKQLRANGTSVCITTGRCLHGTRKVLQQLPTDLNMLTSIHNGAAILDGDRLLHQTPLARDSVYEIVKQAAPYNMKCSVQTLEHTYVNEDPGPYKDILDSHNISPIRLQDFSEIPASEKVLKIAVFDIEGRLKKFMQSFRQSIIAKEINLFQSGSYFADATSNQASKRHSGEWLANYYQVSPESVLAFGDQMNDSDMLKWAGKGVAMGNANPLLHRYADHITNCHNTGGISNFIQNYILANHSK